MRRSILWLVSISLISFLATLTLSLSACGGSAPPPEKAPQGTQGEERRVLDWRPEPFTQRQWANVRGREQGVCRAGWSFQAESWVSSSPVVVNGKVLFGCGGGYFYGLSAADGTLLWKAPGGVSISSSAAAAAGKAYVGSRDDGSLSAVNLDTGQIEWRAVTNPDHDIYGNIALGGGRIYVPCTDGKIYAFGMHLGEKLWEHMTGDTVFASPVYHDDGADGVIFCGSQDGILRALNAKTGTQMWIFRTAGEPIAAGVTAWDGVLYLPGCDSHLYALDPRDGKVLWFAKLDGPLRSTPAVAGDAVIVGSDAGTIHALRRSDGARLWKVHTEGRVISSPAVSDGVVYIGAEDNHLYALDAATGAVRWKFLASGRVFSSPAVAGGVVYFGSADFNVYAVDAKTGKLEAATQTP